MNLIEQVEDSIRHDERLLGDLITAWPQDHDLTAAVLSRIVGNPVLAGSCILTLINMLRHEGATDENGHAHLVAHP